MTSSRMMSKRVRSVLLIVVLALVAVVGLLLLMGQLSAPDQPATDHAQMLSATEPAAENPVLSVKTDAPDTTDIVATVNRQPITRQEWRQATRLDAVMSKLAFQPIPTAEETLDRLVNEILVLDGADELTPPADEAVAARIGALASVWNVSDDAITAALEESGLSRDDLAVRVSRLIQVEAAIEQISAKQADINGWLAQTRASAEIGLYSSLAEKSRSVSAAVSSAPAGQPASVAPTTEPAPPAEPLPEKAAVAAPAQPESLTFAPPPDLPVSPYPQNAAPDFTLPQLDGSTLTLSSLRGKPTIINFWATWCPPCRRELPVLQAAFEEYGDQIGFVAVDVKETADKVEAFVQEMGLTFPVVVDQNGQVSDVAYEVRGIPTTIFVDANGVVSARHIGPLEESDITGYLAPLLAPAPPQVQPATQTEVEPAAAEPNPAAAISGADSSTASAGDMADGHNSPSPAPAVDSPVVAPDFSLASAAGGTVSRGDFGSKNLVLVFYRGYT